MIRIACISPTGGTGQTTLAANLATLLAPRTPACTAIDLCPQNSLGLHLGLTAPAQEGWAHAALRDGWWGDAAQVNGDGVGLLSFGSLAPDEHRSLRERLAGQPGWLARQLDELDLPDEAPVLMDLPAWPDRLADEALGLADLVLVTLQVSPVACQLQERVRQLCGPPDATRQVALVATGLDARRSSQRQALATLQSQWGDRLLPYVVHTDESCPLSLMQATCACRAFPRSQSAHDFQGIARWLGARLGTGGPA